MHHHLTDRRRHRSALALGSLTLALTLASLAPAAADPTAASVSLNATASAAIGDTILVDVDLTGTTDIYTYSVTLGFDPAVLTYVSDSVTGPGGGFTTAAQAPGSVTLVHTRMGTSPPIDGDLSASVSFSAVASGSAAVRATSVTLVGTTGPDLVMTPPAATTTTLIPAAVPTPTPTPEPSPTPTTGPASPTTPAPPATTSPSPAGTSGAPSSDVAARTATSPASTATGSLPRTGFAVGSTLLVAAAAVTAGVLLVRRRSAGTR